jgi:MFS family permease
MEETKPTRRKLNVVELLVLSIYWLSLNALTSALFPIVIPLLILLFVSPGHVGNVQQVVFLGWLSAGGAVISLTMPPIFGLLSDKTTSRFGRRRPFVLGGSILLLISTVMLAFSSTIVIFILGLFIYQVGSTATNAAYQALIPDRVPKEQRGTASGYMGLMTIIGNVGSLGLASWLFGQVSLKSLHSGLIHRGAMFFFSVTGFTILVGLLITIIGVHEIPLMRSNAAPLTLQERTMVRFRKWVVQNWVKPWRTHNFTVVFITRFAVMMGLSLFLTYVEYYFANVAHASNFVQATALVAVLALGGAVFSAFLLGIFSDRVKRTFVVCASTGFMSAASLIFVVAPSNFPLWILGILFGLGYGGYTSVDWALAIDAMPSMETVGKDMAIWGTASYLPAIVAPLLGSAVIFVVSLFDPLALAYRAIFAVATIFLILGAIFILKIRL